MYTNTCKHCGESFKSERRRTRCANCQHVRSGKNVLRAKLRREHALTFVGVDGEGVTRPDGRHEYIMLSVGANTLANWDDGSALSIGQILSFLWECYQASPDACFVGFFLGYDFIQWEKLLPERVAWLLLATAGIAERTSNVKSRANPFPDPVVYDGWEFDVMADRRFKLRPHVHSRSLFSEECRNRTCREVLVPHDCPPILPGEMTFTPSDGPTYDYIGPDGAFWSLFVKPESARDSRPEGWFWLCDTGSFWQTSFVRVIDPKGWSDPVCSVEEFATIVEGKSGRSDVRPYGDVSFLHEMARYNTLENEILGRVTDRLNRGFVESDIPIRIGKRDWYGPGRAAQKWMDMLHGRIADKTAVRFNRGRLRPRPVLSGGNERHNEYGILSADVYQSMPTWAIDAARASYYGGWFEQFAHGHVGDVWEYDINSAYPYIIASLPCLHTSGAHTGEWIRGEGFMEAGKVAGYILVRGRVEGNDPYIGAMPHRTKRGTILRPRITEGWYWWHELEAAKRAGVVSSIEVVEWVGLKPCGCAPPFNPHDIGIEALYRMRLKVGKNSPQGKAAKLVYNSAYGKTAQSVGKPKYANPFYASLITAGTRTLILDAVATHPRRSAAVTMVATDGVYFTERHPTLNLHASTLGAWDETFKQGMTQLMPGVYWDDATREAIGLGGTPKLKSRGVNAQDLAAEVHTLDEMFWRLLDDVKYGRDYAWPEMTFHVRFLLESAKNALHRGKWDTAGAVTNGAIRRISSNPMTKRSPTSAYICPTTGIVRTAPYPMAEQITTTEYEKSFGYLVPAEPEPVDREGRDPLAYWRDLLSS